MAPECVCSRGRIPRLRGVFASSEGLCLGNCGALVWLATRKTESHPEFWGCSKHFPAITFGASKKNHRGARGPMLDEKVHSNKLTE